MKSLTVILCLSALMLLWGCAKTEVAPVPVGAMKVYTDRGFGFTIKYPENWMQLGSAGRALFTESQEMASKFIDPSQGIEGGRVMIDAIPYEGKPAAIRDTIVIRLMVAVNKQSKPSSD